MTLRLQAESPLSQDMFKAAVVEKVAENALG